MKLKVIFAEPELGNQTMQNIFETKRNKHVGIDPFNVEHRCMFYPCT